MSEKLYKQLSTGLYVDKGELTKLSPEQLTATMAEIYKNPNVVFVQSIPAFFGRRRLKELLIDGDLAELNAVCEYHNVLLTDDDRMDITNFRALRDRIDSIPTIAVPWSFAAVPDDWSIENNLKITSNTIRRIGGEYCIGKKSLERVWEEYSKYLVGMRRERVGSSIVAGGYSRYPEFSKTHVDIGCQRIHRYEIEQLAIHFDWEFPVREE